MKYLNVYRKLEINLCISIKCVSLIASAAIRNIAYAKAHEGNACKYGELLKYCIPGGATYDIGLPARFRFSRQIDACCSLLQLTSHLRLRYGVYASVVDRLSLEITINAISLLFKHLFIIITSIFLFLFVFHFFFVCTYTCTVVSITVTAIIKRKMYIYLLFIFLLL